MENIKTLPETKKCIIMKKKNLSRSNNMAAAEEKNKTETDISETTESSNCEQNSPENLCKRDNNNRQSNNNIENSKPCSHRETLLTSTPLTNNNIIIKKLKKNLYDTSSDSEISNDRTYSNIDSNTLNILNNYDKSTGSDVDTSDSSYNEKKIINNINIIDNFKTENIFPICYPLPKFNGRKRFVFDRGGRQKENGVNDYKRMRISTVSFHFFFLFKFFLKKNLTSMRIIIIILTKTFSNSFVGYFFFL